MNVKMRIIHHALLLLNALTLKAATNVSLLVLTSWQKMEEHALVMLVNLLSIKTFSVLFYNAVKIIKLRFIEKLLTYIKKPLHSHGHKDTVRFCKVNEGIE